MRTHAAREQLHDAICDAIFGSTLVHACLHWSQAPRCWLRPMVCSPFTLRSALPAGLVMGPLLLALDVNPLVASATSSFMVLLTVGIQPLLAPAA